VVATAVVVAMFANCGHSVMQSGWIFWNSLCCSAHFFPCTAALHFV
jgi:hypothetical protein